MQDKVKMDDNKETRGGKPGSRGEGESRPPVTLTISMVYLSSIEKYRQGPFKPANIKDSLL